MRFRPWFLLIATAGCVTGSVGAPRTLPFAETTSRVRTPTMSKTVLVVGPSTFQEIDAELSFGVMDGHAVSALERQLFDAGWDPVSKAQLAQLITRHQVAKTLRTMRDRSKATYLDAAASVLASSTADALLLIRDWRTSWSSQAGAVFDKWQLCPLAAELDLALFDRTGKLVWQGVTRTRSTDFLDLTLSVKAGSADTNYPSFACVTSESCRACTTAARPVAPEADDKMAAFSATVLVKSIAVH
jgi:hypothetical protein